MELTARFEQAQQDVKALRQRPRDEEMLKLYALYKQATTGDVKGTRPGMLDFTGRAKYDAWKEVAGLDADDAMESYVSLVAQLIEKYGTA